MKKQIKRLLGALPAALALLLGLSLGLWSAETLVQTSFFPSLLGVYQQVMTTGLTILARDGGRVGIGTGAPLSKLDIGPTDAGLEGGEIRLRGAGSNRYLYLDNYGGTLRLVTQDASGESAKIQIANNGWVGIGVPPRETLDVGGNIQVRGTRTYLRGTDSASLHWIMAGGRKEGTHNALGFNLSNKRIYPGPGWTLNAGPRAQSGTQNAPYGNGSFTVNTSFTPVAAYCSPAVNSWVVAGGDPASSWSSCVCLTAQIVLGPSSVRFITGFDHGPGFMAPPTCPINYIIVGQ